MARHRAMDSDAPCRSRKAGPKWRNTSATSSPSRDTAPPSGGHEVRHDQCYRLQRVQRTGGGADLAGGDAQIARRRSEVAVTKQELDGTQIGARLQQVDRECMA